jgi:hypothetical protein
MFGGPVKKQVFGLLPVSFGRIRSVAGTLVFCSVGCGSFYHSNTAAIPNSLTNTCTDSPVFHTVSTPLHILTLFKVGSGGLVVS